MQAVGLLRELGYANVGHYPGGLTEWFHSASAEAHPVTPPRAVGSSMDTRRASGERAALAGASMSTRFVNALADRPVRELFQLWIAIVVLWGVAYWLMAWLPGG